MFMISDFTEFQKKVWDEITSTQFKCYYKPHYEKYSLANISPTILNHFGNKSKNIIDDEPIKASLDGCTSIVL